MVQRSDFPADFIWGVATSAYQIEGAASADGKGPSIWDTFCAEPGRIRDGTTGREACNHYTLWRDDIALMQRLGVENYRFSLSWPRLIPEGTGARNQAGFDFYNRLIDGLLDKNITPWVMLYHWDLPQGLQDKGGWQNPDSKDWFCDYALTAEKAFGDRIKNWFVFNEPSVVSFLGHATGIMAPGIRSEDSYLHAVHNINRAIHGGYHALKEKNSAYNVGSSFANPYIRAIPGRESAVEMFDALWNRCHLDPLLTGTYPACLQERFAEISDRAEWGGLQTPLDFVGLQYYSPIFTKPATAPDANVFGAFFDDTPDSYAKTSLGWAIAPEDMDAMLRDFQNRYGTGHRLMISENGSAWDDQMGDDQMGNDQVENGRVQDAQRIAYFQSHLRMLAEKHHDTVKGYFVWSLMDNFEWAEGLTPRFGLVYVDYAHEFKRIEKDSYHWFKGFLAGKPCVTG